MPQDQIHWVGTEDETEELPPEDGWVKVSPTGRARVICSCGLRTEWLQGEDVRAAGDAHLAAMAANKAEAEAT